MERQPNTIYVASLSYGKDSIAMLHCIMDILHYPLDRIVHAEVWFSDTIPADLPPMVEFKKKADAIIKERWGIEVEHVCAMKKSQNVNVERERERERLSYRDYFFGKRAKGNRAGQTIGFPMQSKGWCKKLKYEQINIPRYILSQPQTEEAESFAEGGTVRSKNDLWIPDKTGKLVQWEAQSGSARQEYTDTRSSEENGAEATSRRVYGWATKWSQYCTGELKPKYLFGQARERRAENKYRSVPRHCGRRAEAYCEAHRQAECNSSTC